MPSISPRDWLYELAERNDHIRRFIKINNTPFESDRGRPPPDIMTPAALVGIISILVEANDRLTKEYRRYAENHAQPIIIENEWPTTERNVIQSSSNIRFRDFLRSLWRRLQRPWWT